MKVLVAACDLQGIALRRCGTEYKAAGSRPRPNPLWTPLFRNVVDDTKETWPETRDLGWKAFWLLSPATAGQSQKEPVGALD